MTTWATLADHRPVAGLDEPDAILAFLFEQEFAPGSRNASGARQGQPGRLVAVVVAGTTSASAFLLTHVGSPAPADFLTYRYAAAGAAAGVDIYSGEVTGPGLPGQPFTYTPIATVLFWPTTLLSRHAAYLGWTLVTFVVLAAVLSKGTTVSARNTVVLAVAVALVSSTDLLTSHVRVGQIDVLLMGLCLADAARSGHARRGRQADRTRFARVCPPGVLVGVATAIKLTPGLFIVHFVITRQWRLAAYAAAGCAAATAVGAVLRPELTLTFAGSVLWTLSDRVDLTHAPSFAGNQSVTGVLAAVGADDATVAIGVVLVGVAALAAARYVHATGREWDAWLVIGMSAPLLSPFSWNHHYVFVLPALALLARRWWPSRPGATALWVAGLLLLLQFTPGTGDRLVHDGSWAARAVGGLVRENALLAAVACATALTVSARRAARR